MPTPERLAGFIDTVVAGRYVEALRDYYHEDAVTQENNGPERHGLPTLVATEQAVLGMFEMQAHAPSTVLLDGEDVAIRWTFDIADKGGTIRRMDEVALQRWRGDRIERERFFYDPSLPTIDAPR